MDPYNPDSDSFTALFFVIYAITIGIGLLFAAAVYVVMALALSKLFTKVGIDGWIAWVPFYSTWKWLELGGFAGWIALIALIPYGGLVTSVFLYVGMYRTGLAFRKDGSFVVLGIFLPFVWAWLLARPTETYNPELIVQAGFPRPLAGYGSAPAA